MAATKEVSYSELDSYRQCRLKHWLAYRRRWETDRVAPALARGSLFHEVMALHYGRLQEGMLPAGIVQEVQTSPLLMDQRTGSSTEEQDLVAWVYEGYVRLYGNDPSWEIVDVEMRIADYLPTETGHRSSFKLKGHVDLLVRDTRLDGLWVIDHKTCRDLPRGKDLDFDDQAAIYTYLLRRRGLDIRGVIFNHCRTNKLVRAMTDQERFRRTITVRTEIELERMAMEALDTFREAYKPKPRQPPRSPDPDRCGWRCSFTEPCLGGRKGLDLEDLLQDHGFRINETRH